MPPVSEERTGDTYTTSEAARILRISAQRVRKLISDGKLEAERVDDQWHVHAWSVHERMGERPPRRALRALEAPETASELVDDVRGLERALGRLEGRLELSEKAESTIREERDRLLADLEEERSERRRLQQELEVARRPWWQRLFGSS
jgi:excisionase family DNA binding protein